ncbi:MAG: hypothetical protein ACE5ID_01615 [Acidobacteriota bacterium]
MSGKERWLMAGILAGLMAGGTPSPGASPEVQGGLVPTENHPVNIPPGPEPDVTFFATGETLGKIEPCG